MHPEHHEQAHMFKHASLPPLPHQRLDAVSGPSQFPPLTTAASSRSLQQQQHQQQGQYPAQALRQSNVPSSSFLVDAPLTHEGGEPAGGTHEQHQPTEVQWSELVNFLLDRESAHERLSIHRR